MPEAGSSTDMEQASPSAGAAAVMEALSDTDPDALSPREALEALYHLKKLAEQR